MSLEQILKVIRHTKLLKSSTKMKLERRDKGKYCLFHEGHKHSICDCYHLKDEIETLICNGYLKGFVEEAP